LSALLLLLLLLLLSSVSEATAFIWSFLSALLLLLLRLYLITWPHCILGVPW
jgi:hypothetical protein